MKEIDNIFEDICRDVNKESVSVCPELRKQKMLLIVTDASKINCAFAVVRNCLMLFCGRYAADNLESSTDKVQLYSSGETVVVSSLLLEFLFMFKSLADIIRFFYYFMRALRDFVPSLIIDFKTFLLTSNGTRKENLINTQRFRDTLLEHLKHRDLTYDLYTKIIIPVLSRNSISDVRYFIEDYLGKPFDDYSYKLLIENTVRSGCQYTVKEYPKSCFDGIKIKCKNIKSFNVCSKRKQDNSILDSTFREFCDGKIPRSVRLFGLSSKLLGGKYENVVLCVFTKPLYDLFCVKVLFAVSRKTRPMKRSLEEFSIEEVRNLFLKNNEDEEKFNVEI